MFSISVAEIASPEINWKFKNRLQKLAIYIELQDVVFNQRILQQTVCEHRYTIC